MAFEAKSFIRVYRSCTITCKKKETNQQTNKQNETLFDATVCLSPPLFLSRTCVCVPATPSFTLDFSFENISAAPPSFIGSGGCLLVPLPLTFFLFLRRNPPESHSQPRRFCRMGQSQSVSNTFFGLFFLGHWKASVVCSFFCAPKCRGDRSIPCFEVKKN